MTQQSEQPPYTLPDLLLMLGECTVELRFLRGQIVRLEQRLKELETEPANGLVEPLPQKV